MPLTRERRHKGESSKHDGQTDIVFHEVPNHVPNHGQENTKRAEQGIDIEDVDELIDASVVVFT